MYKEPANAADTFDFSVADDGLSYGTTDPWQNAVYKEPANAADTFDFGVADDTVSYGTADPWKNAVYQEPANAADTFWGEGNSDRVWNGNTSAQTENPYNLNFNHYQQDHSPALA